MTIKELKEQRTKLLLDSQNILLSSPTPEQRASAQKMLLDVDQLELDITTLEKIEEKRSEERAKTTPPRPTPGQVEGNTDEKASAEKRAFERYIRFGEKSPMLAESRDITTGGNNSTMSGGQLVPQAYYPVLTEALKSYGNILNIVTTKNSSDGAPMKYALVDDTEEQISVVGEAQQVSEDDPNTITGSTLSTDFLTTGIIKVSLAELQDSFFDLDAWIRNIFGKRYYRGLSSAVTSGNESNIASIVAGAYAGWTTTASSTVIGYADIVALYASLDPAYEPNAKFSFSQVTRGQLLATVDSLGRPLYIPAPTAETFDMLLGKPVVINPFAATAASATVPILYGDHSAYLMRYVTPGLAITRLNERFLDVGCVGFIGFARNGGVLLDAGTHPLQKMVMKTAS